MGILTPLTQRRDGLLRALGNRKMISLAQAARAMQTQPPRVGGLLKKMNRRQLFDPWNPCPVPGTDLVALDGAYISLAQITYQTDRLAVAVREALQTLRRSAAMAARSPSGIRRQLFANYMKNVLDGAFTGNAGNIIRNDTGDLVKNMITPPAQQLAGVYEDAQNVLQAILAVNDDIRQDLLLPTPCEAPEGADTVKAACSAVRHFARTLPVTESHFERKDPFAYARTACATLQADTLGSLQQLHSVLGAAAPASPEKENALPHQIQKKMRDIRQLGQRVQDGAIRQGVTAIDRTVQDILLQISLYPEMQDASSIRSLCTTYLPMTEELLERALRIEMIPVPSPELTKALNACRQTLSRTLPDALAKLRDDVGASGAADVEAQAEALKRKMQLDGLLQPDLRPPKL